MGDLEDLLVDLESSPGVILDVLVVFGPVDLGRGVSRQRALESDVGSQLDYPLRTVVTGDGGTWKQKEKNVRVTSSSASIYLSWFPF